MLVKNGRYGFHHIPNWQWSVAVGAHSGYTLWSVWSGSGRLQIGSENYPLQAGDVFLLDYQAPVFGTENHADILEIRFLDFETDDPQWLSACPIHRRLDQLPFVLELFKRIASAQEAGDENTMTLWAEALLLEYRTQPDRTARSCYSEKIDAICHSFEQRPEQHFDMRELAQHLGLTPDHFIRVFAREKSLTPYAYLSRIRLESAKGLLQNSSLSIGDIASATGFSDLYAFSRFFKAKTGMSPQMYRSSSLQSKCKSLSQRQ